MSELESLEKRLSDALTQIEQGLSDLPKVDEDETQRLQEALQTERAEKAVLSNKLEELESSRNSALEQFEASLAQQGSKLGELDAELQRLRKVNRMLEDNNRALREACETGQVDSALINQAMLAELESLRAARSAETAEVAAVMASLEPLLTPVSEDA